MLEKQKHWQLQEAKNRFSRLVEQAQHNGPQIVTKHGRETVVIISADEYRRLIRPKKDIVRFFQESPLFGEDIDLTRSKETPRNIEL
ncbi:MAG: type II toxin-antitoxin system Phd/YefM family antitoxin [Candidatus Electrothrix sp. GM3_4]|nr:type II toxin-antitoxin system Phd/YefM family antitoxin [Candidatus Electrothrix sp. GM3_4]